MTHSGEAGDPADCDFATRWNPWRVLATWPCDTLNLLSQEWVEHADYRYEWVRAVGGSRECYP